MLVLKIKENLNNGINKNRWELIIENIDKWWKKQIKGVKNFNKIKKTNKLLKKKELKVFCNKENKVKKKYIKGF